MAAGAQAPSPITTDGGEWLEQSRKLIEGSMSRGAPAWMRTNPDPASIAMAEEIARQSGMRDVEQREQAGHAPGTVLVFGSFAMPDATLRNLLEDAHDSDVTFVLRGFIEGTTMRGTLDKLATFVDAKGKLPHVIIDPTLYRQHRIEVAPTLVLLREGGLQPVKVEGAVPVSWLREKATSLNEGDDVDLGRRAEVHDITERDLIELMQERIAGVDWETKRKAAVDNFWRKKRDFVDLPVAQEVADFEIDPSVRVTEDIKDKNGRLLVRAGETFNPLDFVPMTKTVIVFRGTEPEQLAYAAAEAARIRDTGRGVILITTRVDTGDGWKSLNAMEHTVRGPVYVLQADIAKRFRLRAVPSLVRGKGNRLHVSQVAIETTPIEAPKEQSQ